MNLREYQSRINSQIMNPVKRNIIRDKRIEDGSYFTQAVRRGGVLNKDRVLSSNSYQPSFYGEDYEGKFDPLTEVIDDEFKYNRNTTGGNINHYSNLDYETGGKFNFNKLLNNKVTNKILDVGVNTMGNVAEKALTNYMTGAALHPKKTKQHLDTVSDYDLDNVTGGKFNFNKVLNNKVTKKLVNVGANTIENVAEKALTHYMTGAALHPKKSKKKTKKQLELEYAIKILKKHKQI